MNRVKWFDRKFDFTREENIFPSLIHRLKEAPARVEGAVAGVADSRLNYKTNGAWSIKENIGHLVDLEPLWVGRMEDILAGEKYLRATDLQNRKTDEANHNTKQIVALLKEFATARAGTIVRLTQLSANQIYQTAIHPRLNSPMRMMDHFLFVAEHDDHHLDTIKTIITQIP